MAEFVTVDEARSYKLGNGNTVDLIHLIGTPENLIGRDGWANPEHSTDAKIGDTAYVHAMGGYRRGVVSKVTRTKIGVTFTTQGALDDMRRGNRRALRVQTTMSDLRYVLIQR